MTPQPSSLSSSSSASAAVSISALICDAALYFCGLPGGGLPVGFNVG